MDGVVEEAEAGYDGGDDEGVGVERESMSMDRGRPGLRGGVPAAGAIVVRCRNSGALAVWQVARNMVGKGLPDQEERVDGLKPAERGEGMTEKKLYDPEHAKVGVAKKVGVKGRGVLIESGERVGFGECRGVVVPAINWRLDVGWVRNAGGERA